MGRSGKRYILPAIAIVIAIGSFLWVRSHIFDSLGSSIHERIQSLNLSGFNVRYDSISVNWLTGAVKIDNLLLEKNAYDTTCIYPEFIAIGRVSAEGIGIFQLVFRNILTLETLTLDSARMIMRQNSLLKLDSATQRKNEFTLRVDQVFMRSAELMYTDSVECKTITNFKSNITLAGLRMDFHVDRPFAYAVEEMMLDSTEVKTPQSFYTFWIYKARLNLKERGITLDSIRITPDLGKLDFGKAHGIEIDRFEGLIPFFKASEISLAALDTGYLKAGMAETQFYLKIFRDKRMPFLKKQKLLPIAQLRALPFPMKIDSIKVTKSYVEYEETAEGGTETGRIFFDNLYAVFHNVTNVSETGKTSLSAHASLFGRGDLDLFATFPLNKNKRATVSGTIKNFSIPEINSILTPTTQMKVESGQMNELSFNFTYNTIRSDGEIGLNYENLKLVTFKDEPKTHGQQPAKDNLKTFILNTFIFRKNMDEDVPAQKRKGTIGYIRDDSRSIFNFWSKSLVSGIKSAYNLDKMETRRTERELKKEQRLSRREAKKLRRAEKKKDRG